jgi:excisionase family DNA binding protein
MIQDLVKSDKPTKTTTYQQSEILTRADVSKLFHISLVTVHQWVQSGVLKAYRLGTRVYFKRSEIDAAMTVIVPKGNKGVNHG